MQLSPCACVVPPVLFERECLFGTCGGHQITPETILLPTSPELRILSCMYLYLFKCVLVNVY